MSPADLGRVAEKAPLNGTADRDVTQFKESIIGGHQSLPPKITQKGARFSFQIEQPVALTRRGNTGIPTTSRKTVRQTVSHNRFGCLYPAKMGGRSAGNHAATGRAAKALHQENTCKWVKEPFHIAMPPNLVMVALWTTGRSGPLKIYALFKNFLETHAHKV